MSDSRKAPSGAKSAKGSRPSPAKSSKKKGSSSALDSAGVPLPEPIAYLGGRQRLESRRSRYYKQFEELAQLISSMSSSIRAKASTGESPANVATDASPSTLSDLQEENLFPILQVGYLARALGLNVSNKQLVSIVELVEEDGPSTGFVDRRKLGYVLVDAMMTGTLCGPTLCRYSSGSGAATVTTGNGGAVHLSAERLARMVPSLCVQEDEITLLRAFEALDVDKNGYLEEDQIRNALMQGQECLLPEEVDIMWMAMCDPETNCAYYRDFAEILARE